MTRRLAAWAGALTAGAVAVATAAAPAAAAPAQDPVTIASQSFAPKLVDALPGDTVLWSNTSVRSHTVTANDGSFDSGTLRPGTGRFAHEFGAPGVYLYHCTIHLGMTGEVDVRRLTLDPVSAHPVAAGEPVTFTGRTADGSVPVSVQQATADGYRTLAAATPGADGRWSVTVTPPSTGDYRALSGGDTSETRRLLVVDRRVVVRPSARGLAVTVTPPAPGATVVLELFLRERFGWWPAKRARLDYLSRASFRVRGRARARVILTDRDGWTPLVVSRVVRLRSQR